MHIKRFNEEIGFTTISRDRNLIETKIIDNLSRGFAIAVSTKDIKKFFDIISKKGIDNEFHKNHIIFRKPTQYYFILLGKKIFYMDIPSICGEPLEIYTPSFND